MPPKQQKAKVAEKKKRKRRNRRRSRKNGTNGGGINAPQRKRVGGSNRPHRLSGRDFITAVTLSNETSLAPLVSQLVSPSQFEGTRQQVMASVYEKYRYVRCTMEYIPAAASTTGGQILAYFDTDPTDQPGSVASGAAHAGSVTFNAYTRTTAALPNIKGGPWFTGEKPTGEEEKFYSQARLVLIPVVPASGPGVTGPQVVGALYLNWTIEFLNPQIAGGLKGTALSDMGLASGTRYDADATTPTAVGHTPDGTATYFGKVVDKWRRTDGTWPGPGVDIMQMMTPQEWDEESRWTDVGVTTKIPGDIGGNNYAWVVHDGATAMFVLRVNPRNGHLQYINHTTSTGGTWNYYAPVDVSDYGQRIMDLWLPEISFTGAPATAIQSLMDRIATLERALKPVRGKQRELTCDSEDLSSEFDQLWPRENECVNSAVCRERERLVLAQRPCASISASHTQ